ncbi:MAG: 2-amino-4-hydroxy-6-hydroxymethyldihydropteridine diphosphokinase [Candidatus Omnitrophica bacterium]|nr:2-amino-4-hydroxy-6-hydroxymethyldihydropteridine diphosphokinase [Candidatus Omnitrophota bacterium]
MICYLGLGSNLGDRLGHIRRAADLLKASSGISMLRLSAVYETAPWDTDKGQPDYLNAVVEVEATAGPRGLLKVLGEIEQALGRKRQEPKGPRTIDLDILYCGSQVIRDEGLTVPHPGAHARFFVLKPLADLVPGFIDPQTGETVARMLEGLQDQGRWRKFCEKII